jgi:hypothetical protein
VAVVAEVVTEVQRRTLEAECDTVVPAVRADDQSEAMRAYLARAAGDLGVAEQIVGLMAQAMPPDQLQGLRISSTGSPSMTSPISRWSCAPRSCTTSRPRLTRHGSEWWRCAT